MTYRVHLEQLLDIVIQKSESYFGVGEEAGNRYIPLEGTYADKLKRALDEWDTAKNAYNTYRKYLDETHINVDFTVPG